MRVLIACEESQRVCKAFRAKGHKAFSCDLQECSGGRPEWHIKGDVLSLLNGNCIFKTMDGRKRTCLWLKGLKPLKRTNNLPKPEPLYICNGQKCKGKKIGWCEGLSGVSGGQAERSKARAKNILEHSESNGDTMG